MTDPTPDTAVSAAEAGAAATDGLPCACRFRTVEQAVRHGSTTGDLVDPDVPIRECALHKDLRERISALGEDSARRIRRAQAAEAQVVELAGALSEILDAHWPWVEDQDHEDPICAKARTALAAVPADALERAKARDAVVNWARRIASIGDTPWPNSLTKLDALDQGERGT